jgi:hypothetical protein
MKIFIRHRVGFNIEALIAVSLEEVRKLVE